MELYIDPGDYTSVSNMELIFRQASASEPLCNNIQLENDDILESDESFFVILSSSDRAVTLEPNNATVIINNDDSKWFSFTGWTVLIYLHLL